MKCFFCKNHLSDYVDNLLDCQVEDEIKNHIEFCSSCKDYYLKLKKGGDVIKKISLLDPEPDFYESVTKQILGNTWLIKNYKRFFVPINIKGPLFFMILATVAIIASFIFIEINNFSFFSNINFEIFPPESREISLRSDQKQKILSHAKTIKSEFNSDPGLGEKNDLTKTLEIPFPVPENNQKIIDDSEEKKSESIVDSNENNENLGQLIAENNLILKIFINSLDLVNDTKKILQVVEANDAKKASKTELGEIEKEGSYFHMLIPQKNYSNMVNELKNNFKKITIVKSESERVVRDFQYRVIIWVENLKK